MVDRWYIEHKGKVILVLVILGLLRFTLVDLRHFQRHSRAFSDKEIVEIEARNQREFEEAMTEATKAQTDPKKPAAANRGASMFYWILRPGVMVRWRELGVLSSTAAERLRDQLGSSCLGAEKPDPAKCPHWIRTPANVLKFLNCPSGTIEPGDATDGLRFLHWSENLVLVCEPKKDCEDLSGKFELKIEVLDRQPLVLAQLTDLVSMDSNCREDSMGVTPIGHNYVVSTPTN